MTSPAPPAAPQPWGQIATFFLGAIVLLAAQFAALIAFAQWSGLTLSHLGDIGGDGIAVTVIVVLSTPLEVGLLMLLAQWRGINPRDYLGWTIPKRSEIVFGFVTIVALIVFTDVVSWLVGHGIVTDFQSDIYRTAGAAGALPLFLLCFAIVVVTPLGEESLFRGFLFRGWLRSPSDTWPVIVVTAALFAVIHLQYDWYVISQVFLAGLVFGWMRWATGSTLLTMLMHGLMNLESIVETVVQTWFNAS